jgi:hypothetical protein
LEFSTFNPKFFRILKFRAGIFLAREISIRKKFGGRTFSASEPGPIGRMGFCAGACAPSVRGGVMGVFPDFAVIVRKFLGFSTFEPEFFWPGNFQSEKIWVTRILA